MVEQLTVNQLVVGSNPTRGAIDLIFFNQLAVGLSRSIPIFIGIVSGIRILSPEQVESSLIQGVIFLF
jgi:hypothetical protein